MVQQYDVIEMQLNEGTKNGILRRGLQSPILLLYLGGLTLLCFFGFILSSLLSVGLLFLLLDLLLLLPDGFKVSGDEEIDQDVPLLVLLELSSEDPHLSGQHPEDGGDGLGNSVVAGDDDIDELEGSVGVAESDGGDVDVGSLDNGLVVALGVSNDEESGFLELLGDLVGKGSGNPSAGGAGSAASVLAELVDSSLSVLLGTHHDDLIEVGNGGDDSGSELDSLVDLVNFEDVVAGLVASLDEGLHVVVDLFGSQVDGSSEELEDIGGLFVSCHLPQNILINIQLILISTRLIHPTNNQTHAIFQDLQLRTIQREHFVFLTQDLYFNFIAEQLLWIILSLRTDWRCFSSIRPHK